MATSPPHENNWEDAKNSATSPSSEQLTEQQKAHKEDDAELPATPTDQNTQPGLSTASTTKKAQNPNASSKNPYTRTGKLLHRRQLSLTKGKQKTPPASEVTSNDAAEKLAETTIKPENQNEATKDAEVSSYEEAAKTTDLVSEEAKLATPEKQQASDNKDQAASGKKKPLSRAAKILLTVLAILLFLGSTTAGVGYYYYKTTIQKPLAQIYRPVTRSKDEATPKVAATSAPVYDVIKGRSWNILLLGSDNDGKYVFPDVLTQVMMIVHVDTVKNTVTMVSIPRDSWVSVPGFGMHKIDQAFSYGEQQTGKFEDGVRVARDTVETDYGITIDRYAWVGLDGFSNVIDTLGGVDVDIEHPIVDDNYPNDVGKGSSAGDNYAYKRIYLAAGPQHLNGQEALEYVRSRHSDLVGDIGRTQRQQQVLEALKLKLNVTTIVANFSQLLSDLSGNIYTDLNESEMLAFANYGRTILNNPIQHVTLGVGSGNQDFGDLTTIYDTSVGAEQDIVQPNCVNIQPVINSIFDLGNVQSCDTGG
jgi:polyisoprenyl-teichoic acid--peptidoglycan teichoic acid transferase